MRMLYTALKLTTNRRSETTRFSRKPDDPRIREFLNNTSKDTAANKNSTINQPTTLVDVKKCINTFKRGKSPGSDNLLKNITAYITHRTDVGPKSA